MVACFVEERDEAMEGDRQHEMASGPVLLGDCFGDAVLGGGEVSLLDDERDLGSAARKASIDRPV